MSCVKSDVSVVFTFLRSPPPCLPRLPLRASPTASVAHANAARLTLVHSTAGPSCRPRTHTTGLGRSASKTRRARPRARCDGLGELPCCGPESACAEWGNTHTRTQHTYSSNIYLCSYDGRSSDVPSLIESQSDAHSGPFLLAQRGRNAYTHSTSHCSLMQTRERGRTGGNRQRSEVREWCSCFQRNPAGNLAGTGRESCSCDGDLPSQCEKCRSGRAA